MHWRWSQVGKRSGSTDCAGEDTEFAPLLPKLFRILQSHSGSPADIGEEYVDKMRQRVPKACAFPAMGGIVQKNIAHMELIHVDLM